MPNVRYAYLQNQSAGLCVPLHVDCVCRLVRFCDRLWFRSPRCFATRPRQALADWKPIPGDGPRVAGRCVDGTPADHHRTHVANFFDNFHIFRGIVSPAFDHAPSAE